MQRKAAQSSAKQSIETQRNHPLVDPVDPPFDMLVVAKLECFPFYRMARAVVKSKLV